MADEAGICVERGRIFAIRAGLQGDVIDGCKIVRADGPDFNIVQTVPPLRLPPQFRHAIRGICPLAESSDSTI